MQAGRHFTEHCVRTFVLYLNQGNNERKSDLDFNLCIGQHELQLFATKNKKRKRHHAGKGKKSGFKAKTTINRFDYNLKWDRATEAGGLVVGKEVDIQINVEMDEVKQQ